jgi:hypothetical protein
MSARVIFAIVRVVIGVSSLISTSTRMREGSSRSMPMALTRPTSMPLYLTALPSSMPAALR